MGLQVVDTYDTPAPPSINSFADYQEFLTVRRHTRRLYERIVGLTDFQETNINASLVHATERNEIVPLPTNIHSTPSGVSGP